MTQEDIIRMAREAGVLSGYESDLFQRFAALVAAQRPWVGLTDEEIEKAYWQGHPSLLDFGRAIEAKLKERNA